MEELTNLKCYDCTMISAEPWEKEVCEKWCSRKRGKVFGICTECHTVYSSLCSAHKEFKNVDFAWVICPSCGANPLKPQSRGFNCGVLLRRAETKAAHDIITSEISLKTLQETTMKKVVLEWSPKIGDQSLEVTVTFDNKHVNLASIVATKQTISWKPFPGFKVLPETTEQERDLVETHVRTYYDAFFRIVKETAIWYNDVSTVEAKVQKSI